MLVPVEDPRAIASTAPARDVPSRSAVLAVRYRQAVWAWYAADQAGWSPTPAACLEEPVRRLEEAAASVELPARWYFLESARLIRAGDLIGARSAFDSGIAAPVADAAIVPAPVDVPVTVEVGVLPPAVDVAVLPAGVDVAVRGGPFGWIARRWPPNRRS